MTQVYLNSSPNDYSLYASEYHRQDEDQIDKIHHFFSPNSQASSSSNSLTCHLFLNPIAPHEGETYGSQAYDNHQIAVNDEKVSAKSGLKFSLWKSEMNNMNDQSQVKWMSSKMRVMLKMKKSHDPMEMNTFDSTTTREVMKSEDYKSSMEEIDNSSNSTSLNNIPIRVCSDCNTTKTPLWRSGPRGPKSLCNACGIRQRKARRALAAAVATATTTTENGTTDKPITVPFKVKKTQHKDHKKPTNGHVTKHKKRKHTKQITMSPSLSSSSPTNKNRVEDFLVNLSKNLPFYQVFPQDEKEAAILLMALSCGYDDE